VARARLPIHRFTDALALWERAAASPAASDAQQIESLIDAAHASESFARYLDGERLATAALAHIARIAPSEAVDSVTIRAHSALGSCIMRLGRTDDARQHFERAATLARASGDQASECRALGSIAQAMIERGELVEARAAFEQVRALAVAIGQQRTEAVAVGSLASIAFRQGDLATAASGYEQALALFRAIGDRRSEGVGSATARTSTRTRGACSMPRAIIGWRSQLRRRSVTG
jgi:tetratricopeptide (TPR) repeat protein